jgi:hypothetical protein
MYPATILATIALAFGVLAAPRKYFLAPFLICACFLPADQRFIIMSLDFTPLRILVLVGLVRIFAEGRRSPRWNSFDKLVVAWALCGAAVYCLQRMEGAAIINRCGFLLDVLGLYFIFRTSLDSWDKLRVNVRILAVCGLVIAVLVAQEWASGSNPFTIFGNVATNVREGRYRCRGPYAHAIIAGVYWATLVPLFVGMGMTGRGGMLYWMGAAASTFIVGASASSTPVMVLVIGLAGLAVFRFRKYTPYVTAAMAAALVGLHIVMKAPVWHLLSRINIVGGSTGYHRFKLIDTAIEHFGEWAAVGTQSTENWGTQMFDITNQYILEGVQGGILTLALFVLMLFYALKNTLRDSLGTDVPERGWLAWCLFVAIQAHCAAFMGVSYFGQIRMLLYMMLAGAGFVTGLLGMPRYRPIAAAVPEPETNVRLNYTE